ncbi:MAG: hypothetical protein N4A49_15405 [Marinifilaceae bacterium]|jgi:hypothetical protein|nr:hypothetical protein [Marinifilaceae bacterium]
MNLLKDIYYNKEFSSLYLKDNYSLFEFKFEEGDYLFYNIAVKKPITEISGQKVEGYFDLETPYGYGGYYSNTNDPKFIATAFKKYKMRCEQENIIAEFISFHPFNDFPKHNSELFTVCFKDREVVVVDLLLDDEERWKNYASKIRTILRKCDKELIFEEEASSKQFKELYYSTMDKNNAKGFYYFDDDYFCKLNSINEVNLYGVQYQDKTIAMSYMILSNEIAHYHLSANNSQFSNKNGNYYILDQSFSKARENGCKWFLLGGGRTPATDDNLFKFKSKFSNITMDFYLAGNVYNKEIYKKYLSISELNSLKTKKENILRYRF